MATYWNLIGSAGSTWSSGDLTSKTMDAFTSAVSQDVQQKQAAYQAAWRQFAQMQQQMVIEHHKRWAEQQIRDDVSKLTAFVDAEEFVGV